MERVIDNPFDNYGDGKLKRIFKLNYENLVVHEITGGLLFRSKVYLMQEELIERGYDPKELI